MIFWLWLALALVSFVWAVRSLIRKRWQATVIALLVFTNLLTFAAWFLESLARAHMSARLAVAQERVKELESGNETPRPEQRDTEEPADERNSDGESE